ncbi:MAG: nitroreductase family protein [Firmicutes bacterium]|nr:nitroreductase family protein [Bacillota bacterium]
MNEVLKVIEERSSIRKYKEDMLDDQTIELLIKAGLQGPTANNKQEVHISVLKRDNKALKKLACEVNALAGREGCFYYNAPVVFMLSADKDLFFGSIDAGIACENMVLAAQSLGLGSVILGMPWRVMGGEMKDYFAEKFCFPENYEFKIGIAVGYKDTDKVPHDFDRDTHVSFPE